MPSTVRAAAPPIALCLFVFCAARAESGVVADAARLPPTTVIEDCCCFLPSDDDRDVGTTHPMRERERREACALRGAEGADADDQHAVEQACIILILLVACRCWVGCI